MQILQTTQLNKRYGPIQAVDNLSIEVLEGQIFGILGPNGSGKTTTLGIILSIIHADSGSYTWFEGKYPKDESRKKIGAILETPNFYPYLNADDNLEIIRKIKQSDESDFGDVLDLVGLKGRRNSKFSAYSLGMKQRLAIAGTMIGHPEVLIFDEPTNGLDPNGISDIRTIIKDVASTGKAVILASHLLDEVEKICTHVGILKRGKLLASNSIGSILNNHHFIEVACSDNKRLNSLIKDNKNIISITREAEMLIIEVTPELTSADISRIAGNNQLVITHLSERKNKLEEEFIQITKNRS